MKVKSIVMGVVLVWFSFSATTFAMYEDKANAERLIESKAQHILDTMFGPHKFSVVATVKMNTASWSVRYTELANVKIKKKESETYEILPGFTAIKNLSPDQMSRLPFNSIITRLDGDIKGVNVTLIASKTIRKQDVMKAEKLLIEILKLKTESTDSITTVFESFPISRKQQNKEAFFQPNFANVAALSALILLFIFIMTYRKMQKKAIQAMQEAGDSGSGGSDMSKDTPAPQDLPTSPAAESVTEEVESIKNFFGFIKSDNIQNLLDILEKEKLGLQHVSIIVACLSPKCAATVLDTYSVEEQAEIVKHVMKQRQIDKSTIEKMEQMIKNKLESLIGGNRVLTDILNLVSNQSKKNVLEEVKKDPESYKLVRPNVFLIDDMALLKDDEMKLLLSKLNMEAIASLMGSIDKKAKDKVISNLSQSGSEMLTQIIELKGEKSSVKETEAAESTVISLMVKLQDEGKISLRETLSKQ